MWTVRNVDKKLCTLRQEWSKGRITFVHVEGFRWGEWECDAHERPAIDLANPNGFDPYDQDEEWELVVMEDGCWDDWQFPETMTETERERVLDVWRSNPSQGLGDDGWENTDSQYLLEGPLMLTESLLTEGKEESGRA